MNISRNSPPIYDSQAGKSLYTFGEKETFHIYEQRNFVTSIAYFWFIRLMSAFVHVSEEALV
jgi:hypothetical protein